MRLRTYRDGYNRANLEVMARSSLLQFTVVDEPWDGPRAAVFIGIGRHIISINVSWWRAKK